MVESITRSHRPPAQVLADLAGTVLSMVAHPAPQFPAEQLLAAAVFAERVARTLTYRPVAHSADLRLRECGDVALGRTLVRGMAPSLDSHTKPLVKAQLQAARTLVHGCLDLIERPETAELLSAVNELGQVLELAGRWQPSDVTAQAVPA